MTDFPGKRLIENIISLNFTSEYRHLRDGRANKCLAFEGSTPGKRKKAILWKCANVAWHKWSYNPITGLLRNQANPKYCLDNRGRPYAGGDMHLWKCDKSNKNQQWDFIDNSLRTRANPAIAVDAYDTYNGSRIKLEQHHGNSNQTWNWGSK
jgi:hypothetical protein